MVNYVCLGRGQVLPPDKHPEVGRMYEPLEVGIRNYLQSIGELKITQTGDIRGRRLTPDEKREIERIGEHYQRPIRVVRGKSLQQEVIDDFVRKAEKLNDAARKRGEEPIIKQIYVQVGD